MSLRGARPWLRPVDPVGRRTIHLAGKGGEDVQRKSRHRRLCALCAVDRGRGRAGRGWRDPGTTGFTCKEKKEPGGGAGPASRKAHCMAAYAVATGREIRTCRDSGRRDHRRPREQTQKYQRGAGNGRKTGTAEGTTFAKFEIEGCSIAALNGAYEVTGSIRCCGDGSTVICTRLATTTQATLKLRGQKAGIEVTTTVTARAKSTEPFTPLAVTTVETP